MSREEEGDSSPPEGFARHFRRSPLTDPWEPLYSRRTDEAVVLALRADRQHANSRGFVHGGLIAALADNAMGLTCASSYDPPRGLVTVNLTVDFVGVCRLGQWLEIEPQIVRSGATLAFAECRVSADGEPAARANATFRVLEPS